MDRIGVSQHFTSTGVGNFGPAAGQTGTFRGEQVRPVPNAPSLIDSAEELAKFIHEKFESEDKDLDDRDLQPELKWHGLSAEEIAIYLQESHAGDDAEAFDRTVAELLAGQKPPKHVAKQFSQDVTQQSVLLQYALRKGQADSSIDPEVLEGLENAIADLLAEQGDAIQAGLNTCAAAAELAHDRAGVERFQDTYRRIVIDEATLAGALKLLLERLDVQTGEAFSKVLGSTMRALGDDLAAMRSSVEKSKLREVMEGLGHLKVMVTVLDECINICKTLADRHGAKAPTT